MKASISWINLVFDLIKPITGPTRRAKITVPIPIPWILPKKIRERLVAIVTKTMSWIVLIVDTGLFSLVERAAKNPSEGRTSRPAFNSADIPIAMITDETKIVTSLATIVSGLKFTIRASVRSWKSPSTMARGTWNS